MKGKRWTFTDGRAVVAVVAAKGISPRVARRIGEAIATSRRTAIHVNPTLVHHGLAKGAAFHITSTLSGPIADVYGSSPMVARAIAQLVSNAIGEQVEVTRNTLVGKGSVHSRVDSRTPRARTERPSRNPAGDPKPGEVWTTLQGGRCRVISVTSGRVQVLHLETGSREWIDKGEFFASYRAPRRPARNPSRSKTARHFRKTRRRFYGSARLERAGIALQRAKRTPGELSALAKVRELGDASRYRRRARGNPLTVTLNDHEVNEFSRAAAAMYKRGQNDLGHLLSATAAVRTVPADQYDRAAAAYRAWLVFDEPKGRSNPRGGPRIVYNKLLGGWYVVVGPHQSPLNGRFNSKAEAQAWLAGPRRNPKFSEPWRFRASAWYDARTRGPMALDPFTAASVWREEVGRAIAEGKRVSKAVRADYQLELSRASRNPKGRKPSRGDSWAGWRTGDRFVLKHDIRLQEGEFKAGTAGRLTLVDGPPVPVAFAVFDTTPHLYPVPVTVKWLARERKGSNRNPKGRKSSRTSPKNPLPRWVDRRSIRSVSRGKKRIMVGCPKGAYHPRGRGKRKCSRSTRRVNPRKRSSELQRARRTSEMWHEFPATRARRMKIRSRVIPKTLVKGGEVHTIVYRSNKYDGRHKLHEHRFKRPLPVLAFDPDGRAAYLVGGGYKITGDGLVN